MNPLLKATLLASAALVATAPMVFAQQPRTAPGNSGNAAQPRLFSILNAQQKAQVNQLVEESAKRTQPILEKMRAFAEARKGQEQLNQNDQAEWNRMTGQLTAEQNALRNKVLALLTPDQKARLQSMASQQQGTMR